MKLHFRDPGESGERGAVAIMTALLSVVLLSVAALGVDITSQVNERQKLHDTIDAAAHAGAYSLPNAGTARSDALANALRNDPAVTPDVDFFCVVASIWNGSTWAVDTTQIPATCNPSNYTGFKCNSKICSIPCNAAGDQCNTVRVSASKAVPFAFGPAIGIDEGSTGSVTSVACKGSCGTVPLNPMDVAVVADRTGSMSSTDVNAMIAGIKGMLQVMTPSQQYVALGTIGRSTTTTHSTAACTSTDKGLSWPSSSATAGAWVPVNFTNDYLTGTSINTSSPLITAVNCLTESSGTGTHLASPMKYAARYLLNIDANNLTSLPTRTGTPRKAIIFETDGQPNEKMTGGSATLATAGDFGAGSNGATACTNMRTVAANAKAQDILIVTVAFNLSGTLCGSSGSPTVASELAAAATEKSVGVPSVADNACSNATQRATENADGDYFFCAASGDNLAPLFKTAFTQIANGIRLIRLP